MIYDGLQPQNHTGVSLTLKVAHRELFFDDMYPYQLTLLQKPGQDVKINSIDLKEVEDVLPWYIKAGILKTSRDSLI